MANNLLNMMGIYPQQNNVPNVNLFSQLNALRSNPIQFLAQRRLNLPQNFTGGPREIVQYLLSSGQMSQDQFNRLSSMIR